MRTKAFGLCAVTAAGLLGASESGQVVWCDTLDTYTPGLVVGQDCVFGTDCNPAGCPPGNSWQGWDFDPNASRSVVVDDPSRSGPNSLQISFSTTDDLIHTYNDFGLTSGVYAFEAWQFIPSSATNGVTWFNLFNRYDGMPPHNNPDWSVATQFNMATNEVIAWADGGTLPLVKGEWIQIRVVINLDDDTQEIFYNGDLLVAKSWSGGVGEGGLTELQAIDLFAASGTTPVYYDDLSITELEPFGACCEASGTCTDGLLRSECEAIEGGIFQGIGSACFSGRCPVLGPDGWELEAPFVWGDAQGRNDSCDIEAAVCEDIYEGNDLQFNITIPWPSNWTFSTAGSELLDTEMLIGTSGICSDDLVDDGGCVPGPGCTGSQDEEGTQAAFTLDLDEGQVYVDLEEFAGECGKYNLSVQAPCPAITLPAGDAEGEPCDGENRTNDGCNMDPGMEAFTPIALDQTILGTSWESGGGTSRDTDWYQIEFSAKDVPNTYEVSVYGEFGGTGVGGWIQYNEGAEGSGDCDDISGFISPFGTFDRCSDYPEEGKLVVATEITVAGTYWIFVGPAFGGVDFACDSDPGANYYIQVSKQGNECTPRPDGDADGSGTTDFDDLLIVLSKWGTAGPDGDLDCDGDVDFDDLLLVLSGWD